MKILATAALIMLTVAPAARPPLLELDSCHDDLDRVRRTSSDASDAAEDAKSKFEEFEDCRRDPQFHDLLGDGCRSRQRDYQSALSDLESQMDDLDSRLWSVRDSCGYEFTINRISAVEASKRRLDASKLRLCTSLKGLTNIGMPPDKALQMCRTNADEQWCRECLGLK
jgi:uncharacterized protein (DUF3084 family)